MTGTEMVGCHHWLNGHEFEPAERDGDGQGSLAYCSTWVKKSQTQQLNHNNSNYISDSFADYEGYFISSNGFFFPQ